MLLFALVYFGHFVDTAKQNLTRRIVSAYTRHLYFRAEDSQQYVKQTTPISEAADLLFMPHKAGWHALAKEFPENTIFDIFNAGKERWDVWISVIAKEQKSSVIKLKLCIEEIAKQPPWLETNFGKTIVVQPHKLPKLEVEIFSTLQLQKLLGKWRTSRLLLQDSTDAHDNNNHIAQSFEDLQHAAIYSTDDASEGEIARSLKQWQTNHCSYVERNVQCRVVEDTAGKEQLSGDKKKRILYLTSKPDEPFAQLDVVVLGSDNTLYLGEAKHYVTTQKLVDWKNKFDTICTQQDDIVGEFATLARKAARIQSVFGAAHGLESHQMLQLCKSFGIWAVVPDGKGWATVKGNESLIV